ncbi:UDP-glucose/GDP-mannose dehydrogenase family protein [Pelagibacteraceae bacterium]|nr:UDP-glucose/GDP-mannose dehydrogenase family protein [Pelagibacteraceae bacterium]MDC0530002.1 UDP-glucose/GDP-mannose dehydrogenase family protein [Pelagibacteraceae bacterium]MDC0952825.1 UDP-glucose/GDP-mannose dehydrogenase family protein [Pelagibacteraceae bacterium]
MKICMIGTGYVGLVSGTCFADIGHQVYCVDKDVFKINKLNSGISPIYEPGLDELIKKNHKAKRLHFTSNLKKAITVSDIIFICVGTPNIKGSLKVNLSFVFKCTKEILSITKKKKIIVTKSTVPVGTGDQIENIIKKKRKLFSVISNPEFLREGEAIRDFRYPDRIVIGSNNKNEFKIMKKLYSPLINKGAKFFSTSRRGAELIKYAANAFLATKITFINEIANLCEKSGINVEDIALGIGSDTRIGSRFLRPGPAYGGSCFPKDTKGLVSAAEKFKTNLSIVKSVIKSNHDRVILLIKRVHKILGSNLKGKKISILGVTFKPNTDDMRDSTSLKMMPYLSKKGAIISYYDPSGEKNEFKNLLNCKFKKNIKENCLNADLIILLTEWDEFKSIDFQKAVKKKNFKVYDLRNIYTRDEMKRNKIKYYSIGRPDVS